MKINFLNDRDLVVREKITLREQKKLFLTRILPKI